jgi:homoserine kinase
VQYKANFDCVMPNLGIERHTRLNYGRMDQQKLVGQNKTARVRVPATMANLGPGFDSLGLAVSLWLEVNAELASHDAFEYHGQGHVLGTNNLIHQGFRAAFEHAGLIAPKVRLVAKNPIPLARGLGSSSAALVAGAALASAFIGDLFGKDDVLKVCAKLEGHPDNVAPAVLGGFTASVMRGDIPISVSMPVPKDWRVLVAVPRTELKTEHARAALPISYSRTDMVFNLSRAALWVAGVATGRNEVLREACLDAMHQPYRAPLVPGMENAIASALEAGALAAFLSGAGPSVSAIVNSSLSLETVRTQLEKFSPDILILEPASGFEMFSVVHGR